MLLCAVFVVGAFLTAPSQTTSIVSTNDVTVAATPPSITHVLTRHVAVNCSLPHNVTGDFSTVISLIVSKADQGNDGVFKEVASLTEYSQGVNVRNLSLGALGKGQIIHLQDSYISLEWDYPEPQVAGSYRCEAFGVDKLGHPRTSVSTVVLTETPVTIEMALQRVRELNNQVDTQDKTSKLYDRLLAKCGEGQVSGRYNDTLYYLSGLQSISVSSANTVCKSLGGYLAEVGDAKEFVFLQELVRQAVSQDKWVTLGGTDQGHEGQWTYWTSGTPLTYTNWGPATSHDSTYNCQFMHRSGGRGKFLMEDGKCGSADRYILCEVPLM